MKKTIAYPAVLFFSLVLLSCSKNSNESLSPRLNPERIINAKINAGETYLFDMDNIGALSIIQQAVHFSVSEIATNEKGYQAYKYIPAAGFLGTDEVVLSHKTETAVNNHNNGCNNGGSYMSSSTSSITLKLTVQ